MSEQFKPKMNESYYYVFVLGEILVYGTTFLNDEKDKRNIKYGNCYRTRTEATAKLKLIKKLLKERESCSLKNK